MGVGRVGGRAETDLVLGEGKGLKSLGPPERKVTSGNRRLGEPSRMYQKDFQDSREELYTEEKEFIEPPLQQEDRTSSEGWGCHPTVTTLTHNCSCLKELQGWKWRGA